MALWLAACGMCGACAGGTPGSTDAGGLAPPESAFDAAAFSSPPGEALAFGAEDGPLRNYFARQGPAAAHVLTRSGEHPRLLVAFPAENQGIGVWLSAPDGAELWIGDAAETSTGAGLAAVQRSGGARDAYGVRGTLRSSAASLSTELMLLANVRTLRDYGYGVCLEDAGRYPLLRNESIELSADGQRLRVRREQIGGTRSLELLLQAQPGTRFALSTREAAARPECPLSDGGGQARLEITGEDGVALDFIALSDETPLSPIEPDALLSTAAPEGPDRAALAFLSHDEKLLAGSWRFLTYFGRDTLLSLWLLQPALASRVMEAGLGAVLERVQLAPGVAAPDGGVIDVGDVAHEEEVGDYAAWQNTLAGAAPGSERQPRYDYKMIDDDFLLAPVVASFMSQGSDLEAFLARPRADGATFGAALSANLALVLQRARPFADAPPAERASKLIALRPGLSVGEWRDSEMGLAFGRYPFDVNAALVPAALEAAARLYERLGEPALGVEAARLATAWQGAAELFRTQLPLQRAQANVRDYASALGVADDSAVLQADADAEDVSLYGVALDASGRVLPVMHSDHGFALAFTNPAEPYLAHVASLLTRAFPAGLVSAVGVMVANPALADPGATVIDPKDLADPADDSSTPLRELFTPARYHGAVVWSWQQALLARGLRRQLDRADLSSETRSALSAAECAVWRAIDLTAAARTRELWSWAADARGQLVLRPFGGGTDADESNAIQLWSTVYLAVRAPTPEQNAVCGVPGVGP